MPPSVRASAPSREIQPAPTVVAAFVFLLLVAFSTRLTSEGVTARSALLVLAMASSPWAVRKAWSAQPRATACALGFAAATALSAATSGSWLSVFGHYDWNTGLLFVFSLVTCWALGVGVREKAAPLLTAALLGGFVVNAVVAVLQMQADLGHVGLPRFEGRASGLLGNPVHLAALAAGAFAMAAWSTVHSHVLWGLAALVAVATVQVSGSRLGLIVIFAGTTAVVLRYRSLRAVVVVAAVAVGLVTGEAASATAGGPTGVQRAVISGGNAHARVEAWTTALSALADRPVLGVGPGRFQAGIAPFRTLELAKASPDSVYLDAHNPVFEYAVTTGGVGVLLLAVWMVAILISTRASPLFWFGVGVLALHLAQPQFVGTTPAAFLALGAASRDSEPRLRHGGRWALAGSLVLAPLAAYAAVRLLAGDARLANATADRSAAKAESADALLPPWSQPARRVAELHAYRADREDDDALRLEAVEWLERAAERDPTRAYWWYLLADYEAEAGNDIDAATHYRRALAADPYSPHALMGLARIERHAGNVEEAIELLRRADEVVDSPKLERMVKEYSDESPAPRPTVS